MPKLSIVVPIYKNELNIKPFYMEFCENIKPYIDEYEIIMVHDASPDASWRVMNELVDIDRNVKLIKLSRNFGAIAASFTGIQYATGDCVTVKACDLQEPSQLILDMYQKWKEGAKSVIAVRESRNDSLTTKFSAAIYYKLLRRLVTSEMPDGGFDTYLIDKNVAKRIVEINDHNSPITLQILWMGFGPEKVYYERRKREIGKSSWSFSKKLKLFIDSFVGFSYIPLRMISTIGIIFSVCAIAWALYLIVVKLLGKIPIQGYTTILVMVLFSSGLIMFTLGLLGEYIWRVLDATRRRPISIIDEMVNIGDTNEEKDINNRR